MYSDPTDNHIQEELKHLVSDLLGTELSAGISDIDIQRKINTRSSNAVAHWILVSFNLKGLTLWATTSQIGFLKHGRAIHDKRDFEIARKWGLIGLFLRDHFRTTNTVTDLSSIVLLCQTTFALFGGNPRGAFVLALIILLMRVATVSWNWNQQRPVSELDYRSV